MPCTLGRRAEVSDLVIAVYEAKTGRKGLSEQTPLGDQDLGTGFEPLGLDELAQRGFYFHIGSKVAEAGCTWKNISSPHFVKSKIENVVDRVCKALDIPV